MEKQTLINILASDLLSEVMRMKNENYRLVVITCTNKDGMELSYSFDKEYELITLRFVITTETEIESVTCAYPYAFLYENEIKELFGVSIQNITVDFQNTLYQIPVKTPFHIQSSQS